MLFSFFGRASCKESASPGDTETRAAESAVLFLIEAYQTAQSIKEVSLCLHGKDEQGRHIQCWYRPVRLFGGGEIIPINEWAARAVRKVRDASSFDIQVSMHDADGDYRSFTKSFSGHSAAVACVRGLVEVMQSSFVRTKSEVRALIAR